MNCWRRSWPQAVSEAGFAAHDLRHLGGVGALILGDAVRGNGGTTPGHDPGCPPPQVRRKLWGVAI